MFRMKDEILLLGINDLFYLLLLSLFLSFMVFVYSQFLHHPPIFASLLCFLSSFVHLRFCAHTPEHMVWRGSLLSSVPVCYFLFLKLFCTRLHVQAPLVQMLANSNRMEQCTMDAALGTRGTPIWPSAHTTLLQVFFCACRSSSSTMNCQPRQFFLRWVRDLVWFGSVEDCCSKTDQSSKILGCF